MFWWLTQHLLVTGVFAILVWLASRGFRMRPALQHLLWLMVLIKLMIPPAVAWPWSLQDLLAPTGSPPAPLGYVPTSPPVSATGQGAPDIAKIPPESAQPGATVPAPAAKSPDAHRVEAPDKAGSPPLQPMVALKHPDPTGFPRELDQPASAPRTWSFPQLAAWLALAAWCVGTLVVAATRIWRIVRFRREVRTAQRPPRWLERQVKVVATDLSMAPPRILIVQSLGTPSVWSLGFPCLLWPAGLIQDLDAEQQRGVITHELAHIRRRDHWVEWLILAADCLWWWNPIHWLIRRELRRAAELACDAWVLWALPDHRRSYAEALLQVTRNVSQKLTVPAIGMSDGGRRDFQRRLTMIMSARVPCRLPAAGILMAGLLGILVLPAWSLGFEDTRQKQDKPARTQAEAEELRAALLELQAKKSQLEEQLRAVQQQLIEASTRRQGEENQRANSEAEVRELRERLANLYTFYNRLSLDLTGNLAPAAGGGMGSDVTQPATRPAKRNWGPEQATGAPDADNADDPRAWASLTQDGQDEWLTLHYEEAVAPMAVLVYENYNPGAIDKISIFTDDDRELQVWKKQASGFTGQAKGCSMIPLPGEFLNIKTRKIKLYLKSKEVPGWNEIDAVGLLDGAGKLQWATKAEASSSFADRETPTEHPEFRFTPSGPGELMTGIREPPGDVNKRFQQLEHELQQLRSMVEKLIASQPQSFPKSTGSKPSAPGAMGGAASIETLQAENDMLREQLRVLKQLVEERNRAKTSPSEGLPRR